ncbi:putative chromosomal passenger protein [Trypanosoma conorhini]|uniref:Putative chromosomal passenger protein n=1 Tax=Trypanosoma conorhini TaxID=83891 RepID=A0A422PMZ2_9TRYP|nr:putative chromosomal passenger protein [Trypanosoma conorhini]RNF19086.1 putative chromosomal passenger protein [Trypanosoma conorhini]
MLSNSEDYFAELRAFPPDAHALHNHGARLNYILQKRHKIPAEMAELALQPQSSEEFERFYRKQVMRIVDHFNAMTQRHIKVKVDQRLPRGMQVIRGGAVAVPRKGGKTEKAASDWHAAGAKVAAVDHHNEFSVRKANAKMPHLQSEGQQTPKAVSPAFAAGLQGYTATDGKTTLSSDDRSTILQSTAKKTCREVLFGTPPEFKGFNVPLEASPADSFLSKSPLLF